MDKRIDIWNILHDGEITSVEQNGDILTMVVSIPYLRRRIQPLGDSFVLTIKSITQLDIFNYDGHTLSLTKEVEEARPEILSTDSTSMPIKINLTIGQMVMSFEDISITLDTGGAIDFEQMEKVCDDYWTEWKAKSRT